MLPAHCIAPLHVRNEPNILASLNDQTRYVQNDRYTDTKAIGVMLTQQLAKLPLLKDVVVCSVNPGFCRSELLREWPTPVRS
jgi:NADP-dependent 3-hydroxy acid dehydrogenase YdfG